MRLKIILSREIEKNEEHKDDHWKDYNQPKYENYEIEYYHGYNRGDARFEQMIPGHYILRICPEKI